MYPTANVIAVLFLFVIVFNENFDHKFTDLLPMLLAKALRDTHVMSVSSVASSRYAGILTLQGSAMYHDTPILDVTPFDDTCDCELGRLSDTLSTVRQL